MAYFLILNMIIQDENQQYLSEDKFKDFEAELADLKENKIPIIAKRIDDARQMGDLSENAEYHAARDEMSWAQTRVKEIDNIIKTSMIINITTNDDEKNDNKVRVGSIVRIKTNKIERSYSIVGAQEADPLTGKISNESPLGKALLGSKKGDKVEVSVPAGSQIYEILEIK